MEGWWWDFLIKPTFSYALSASWKVSCASLRWPVPSLPGWGLRIEPSKNGVGNLTFTNLLKLVKTGIDILPTKQNSSNTFSGVMKLCDEIPKDRDTSRNSDFVYFEPFIKRHGNATKSWAEATNSCGLNQPLNGGFLSPGDTPDTIIQVRASLSIETNGFFEVFWDPRIPHFQKPKKRRDVGSPWSPCLSSKCVELNRPCFSWHRPRLWRSTAKFLDVGWSFGGFHRFPKSCSYPLIDGWFPWENRSKNGWFGATMDWKPPFKATRNVVQTTSFPRPTVCSSLGHRTEKPPVPHHRSTKCSRDAKSSPSLVPNRPAKQKTWQPWYKSHMLDVSNIAASQRLCHFASLSFCHVLICSSSQHGDRSKNHHADAPMRSLKMHMFQSSPALWLSQSMINPSLW